MLIAPSVVTANDQTTFFKPLRPSEVIRSSSTYWRRTVFADRNLLFSEAVAKKRTTLRSTIALIGSGNLAQALGPALRDAGYQITVVAFRDNRVSKRRAQTLAKKLRAKPVRLHEVTPEAYVTWLCHTDDALAATARDLARKPGWKGKIVLHSSGALPAACWRRFAAQAPKQHRRIP